MTFVGIYLHQKKEQKRRHCGNTHVCGMAAIISPFSRIFPEVTTQYTNPMCPITQLFPTFPGWLFTLFPPNFQKRPFPPQFFPHFPFFADFRIVSPSCSASGNCWCLHYS